MEVDNCDLSELDSEHRDALEADSFWCFSKLMDGIQENYTFAQPGIQKKVAALKELISRIDGKQIAILSRLKLFFTCTYFSHLQSRFTNISAKTASSTCSSPSAG